MDSVHECARQTDGRTDGQTDRFAITKTALSIASRGKNHSKIGKRLKHRNVPIAVSNYMQQPLRPVAETVSATVAATISATIRPLVFCIHHDG